MEKRLKSVFHPIVIGSIAIRVERISLLFPIVFFAYLKREFIFMLYPPFLSALQLHSLVFPY